MLFGGLLNLILQDFKRAINSNRAALLPLDRDRGVQEPDHTPADWITRYYGPNLRWPCSEVPCAFPFEVSGAVSTETTDRVDLSWAGFLSRSVGHGRDGARARRSRVTQTPSGPALSTAAT